MEAAVTGDLYLDLLVRFVGRHAGALLDGAVTLRLHPVGLHYVASRLESLRELEAVGAGAPVDYLRAYVADLGDHRALERLRRILRLLTSLKVVAAGPGRDPAPLSLLPFARLRMLELRGCDLSTSAARGLLDLRHTLEKLVCHNSTDALRHVFASRIADIKDSPVWSRLSYVSCACNGLVLMDESLQLLPAVETLDLSRNRFAKVDNLRKCTKLRHLDLGFNQLRSISSLSEVCSRIMKLVVRNNALTTLRGVENLNSLAGLDLSYNIISSFSELEILGGLSLLQNLWLEGNPICCARWYRAHVFSFFPNSENLKLDDKGMNTQEYWEKQVIFASRQKQPVGYGFYFPAKDELGDEDTLNSKMKKSSRLACILEEEGSLCDEAVEQQSAPCDSDSSKKDENAAADNDMKITSLINTAELMKKERPTNWLREFKEWMDENLENTGDSLYVEFTNGNGSYKKQNKSQKSFRKSSKGISDFVQTLEGEGSSNLLESDVSFTDDACTGANGVLLKSSNEVNVDKAYFRPHLNSFHQLPPLELVGRSHSDTFSGEKGAATNFQTNGTPSVTMSKFMESSPSFAYPGPQSPPQYKEDILHRRLYLEEEFMQISGDLHWFGSLGSGSSCSDDSSGDLYSCSLEDDCLATQTKMELAVSDQMALFPCIDSDHDQKNEKEYITGEKSFSDYCAEDDPNCSDASEFSIEELHDRNQKNDQLGRDSGHLLRQKGKQKLKGRVIPIFKNHNGTRLEFLKDNGHNVDEDILVRGNGHPKFLLNKSTLCCKELGPENVNPSILNISNSSINTNTISPHTDKYKLIEGFFNMRVANKVESETCGKVAYCEYLLQDGICLAQRQVALLRSSQNKLYALLTDMAQDGQEAMSRVLWSYRMEDMEKVLIGLGLQALRVYMVDNKTHLFLTRTLEETRDVLCLLNVSNFPQLTNGMPLQSWENIQVKLLEKCICGSLKMGIFLYSMLMFWKNDNEDPLLDARTVFKKEFLDPTNNQEESLVARSLFVIQGSILVCIEDLDQFGCLPDDSKSPYFSLDTCCSINNILELVVDHHDKKCLTMVLDNNMHDERFHGSLKNLQNKQSDEITTIQTWKLKWFSEETLLKFISVLKALYSAAAASPLPVKCIS